MSETKKIKEMKVPELLDIIKCAYVIKDWGDQYRIYAKDAVVFVFVNGEKQATHFSTHIMAGGKLNKINLDKKASDNVKSAIDKRYAELYIPTR